MKNLVVLTGSGISSESGLKTFREAGGLWEEYDVMEVASIEGWYRNPELVLRFYNERRAQLEHAKPNPAHAGLVELEEHFNVQIITQNVDNLHEKAGSSNVVHLHGRLTEVRCVEDCSPPHDIGHKPVNMGDTCKNGHQLRPNIVWFGEMVPAMEEAATIARSADIFAVIGTSMVVYPAASLLHYIPDCVPVFLVDPNDVSVGYRDVEFIREKAGIGIRILIDKLKNYKTISNKDYKWF
ncbi:MAG: NAD-dependent deacylase [Bacteroidales bacterium]|nr:NAD-dependent deacylase [Bacteroidales bacterium]